MTLPDQHIEIPAGDVSALHRRFMAGIDARVRAAIEVTGNAHLYNDLHAYLLTATRKRQDVAASFLQALAASDSATIMEKTQDLTHLRYFSASQQKAIEQAATRRCMPPELQASFAGQSRIYLDVVRRNEMYTMEQNIREHLARHGYTVTDYAGGYATDAAGKNQMKIGRILQNNDKLKFLYDGYKLDSTRIADTMVVITCDPVDIARMSAGRHWNSCMSPHRNEFDAFVPKDIEHCTIAAFLTRKSDPEFNYAISRLLIKPYSDGLPYTTLPPPLDGLGHDIHSLPPLTRLARRFFGIPAAARNPPPASQTPAKNFIFVPEGKIHGFRSPELRDTVDRFVAQLNAGKPDGAYYLSPALYCDSGSSREYAKQGDKLRAVAGYERNFIPALDY